MQRNMAPWQLLLLETPARTLVHGVESGDQTTDLIQTLDSTLIFRTS
jgi:hypothetical protein